jgi:hypothetical protein
MSGWAFWLARYRDYRIYRGKRGFPLHVRPLFRTRDVWCGIELDTLEPDNPDLLCWHPRADVFTCAIATPVRCTNRRGRGFAIDRRGRAETF